MSADSCLSSTAGALRNAMCDVSYTFSGEKTWSWGGGAQCSVLAQVVRTQVLVLGLPRGSVVKNPPANEGEVGSIPESGRSPGEGNGNPL